MISHPLPPLPWKQNDLKALIPHRPPFLFLTRVEEFRPFAFLNAKWCAAKKEAFFKGHFPGRPIVPGVLILESMAQAAAILAFASCPERIGAPGVHLMGIDRARFRRSVLPEEEVSVQVKVERRKGSVWRVNGKALVEGKEAARATFLAKFLEHP